MFSNCNQYPRGHVSHGNISLHAYSNSSYSNSNQVGGHARGGGGSISKNFLTSCMQAMCGLDADTTMTRKYSTTLGDDSSITALTHHNLNFEDECRISLSRFTKKVNGRDVRYIQAQATLLDDKVDEAHDLFYLVQMPETSNVASVQQHSPQTLKVNKQLQNDQTEYQVSFSGTKVEIENQPGLLDARNRRSGPIRQFNIDQVDVIEVKHRQHAFQMLSQHQKHAAGGAYMAAQNSDFVNQHTGSFTFHPQCEENDNRSLSGTRNSSQPILDIKPVEAQETPAAHNHIAIHAQQERCDTETHQRTTQNMTEKPNLLAAGSSDASSQLLLDRSTGGVAMASGKRLMPRLPRTYGDLVANFTVQVKQDKKSGLENRAIGCFPLNKVPDGKYRIYYFRPKNRNRLIGGTQSNSCSAQDKIQRVGRGQEFYIFDKNSSQSPSKRGSQQDNSVVSQEHQHKNGGTASASKLSSKCDSSVTKPAQSGSKKRAAPVSFFDKSKGKPQKNSVVKGTNSGSNAKKRQTAKQASDLKINTLVSNTNQTAASAQKDLVTPVVSDKKQLAASMSISPDEIDALVCNPDSQETDPVSKESFNTDRIRQENLNQNFVLRSSLQQEADEAQNMSSGLGSAGGLTFGANSVLGSQPLPFVGSQVKLGSSDTLANLQEIYSVHQSNIAAVSQEENNTLKAVSVVACTHDEQADTPNLYQSLSQEVSQQTASLVEPSISVDGVAMMPKFAQHNNSQQNPEDSKPSQSKFMLKLNTIGHSDELGSSACDSGLGGGAIRVEKQASYTKSPSESSCSGGGQASQTKPDISSNTNVESSSQYGVTSAFAAAEIKVRKSQIQMFNNSNGDSLTDGALEGLDSVDIVVSEDKVAAHETQGPPIILPQQTQSVDEMINEVVLTPVLDRKPEKECSIVNEEIESKQISFLQQLIDTRGPSDGQNMITVMPLSGHCDQLMASNLGYSNKQQKHSRAIAFSDGSNDAGIEQPILSPVWCEGEPPNNIAGDPVAQEQIFQSPNKAIYREMIDQCNQWQNSQQVQYDQITRNQTGAQNARNYQTAGINLGNSDRKQLSTVEEENASQCSDLTSLHQHHSRFFQTQQSNRSRKSQQHRSSIQGNTGNGFSSTHKVPGPFRISEEPSEVDPGEHDPAFDVSNCDQDEKLRIQCNEAGGGESASGTDDTYEKVKIPLFQSNNISATSTKTCSKQPSQAALSNYNNTGVSEARVVTTAKSSANKHAMLSQHLSDYYMLNKSGSPAQKEKGPNGEESSSSLLDLEQNDWNLTSDLTSMQTGTNQTGTNRNQNTAINVKEEQKQTLNHSPYMVVGSQGSNDWNKVGNFKSKRSVAEGVNVSVSSGEGAQSQESELLESVHLTCSENLNDEAGSASKNDSQKIIQLIDSVKTSKEVLQISKKMSQSSHQNTPSVQSISDSIKSAQPHSSNSKPKAKHSCKKQAPARKSLPKGQSGEHKKIIPFKTKQTVTKQSQSSSSKTQKENYGGSSSLHGTPHGSSLTESSQRQSLKHMTPILNKSHIKNPPMKLQQLVQKQNVTPQLLPSTKSKQQMELGISERKIAFQPMKTSQFSSSSVLLLTQMVKTPSSSQIQLSQPPSQPLLKQREIFANRTPGQIQQSHIVLAKNMPRQRTNIFAPKKTSSQVNLTASKTATSTSQNNLQKLLKQNMGKK